MPSRSLWTLGLILALASCGEDVVQPDVMLDEIGASLNQTSDPPSEWPVSIDWTTASASFPPHTLSYPRNASVEAAMGYNAHHASIGATLFLKGKSTDTRTYAPIERHTPSFGGNVHSVTFPMMVPSNCGHTLEAHVNYRAWFQVINGASVKLILEDVPAQRYTSAMQLGCVRQEDRTVPAGGGGGGDCPTCVQEPAQGYTWCKVRTKYYLDTGEIISQTVLYCW